MNYRKCQHSSKDWSLPFVLLIAVLVFATAGCSNPQKAKAEHVSRGEAYLKEKKYQEASLEFRNALQIDDRLAAAHWGLAQAYEGLGSGPQMFAELKRTVELDGNNLEARVRYGNYIMLAYPTANDAQKKELMDEAEKQVKEILSRDKNYIEGHILNATILFAQDKRKEAFDELTAAVNLDPKRVESQLSLALYYQRVGDMANADATYRKAISLNDHSAAAHMQYARFFVQQNRLDMAEVEFKKAVEGEPDNRIARRILASFYLVNKQYDKAEEAFKGLAALDGDKPEGRAILADFYSTVGRFDEAINLYQDILKKSPEYTQGRYRLGEIMLQRGDIDGASEQVKQLIAKNPNDRDALKLRARISMQQGSPKSAIEDLKQVLKQDAHDVTGLYFMTDANLRAGQLEQARVFLGDLEKTYPDYLPAKLMEIQLNLASGDWQSALRLSNGLLDQLARVAPDQQTSPQLLTELRVKTLIARATANLKLNNNSAARADFQAAQQLEPNSPGSYINLATVSIVEGNIDEAKQMYERALSIDNSNFEALNNLTNLYIKTGHPDQAMARIDQAIAVKPDNAGLHFIKAQIYGAQQNSQGAIDELQTTLAKDKNYTAAYNLLGNLYVNLKKPQEAIDQYRKILEKRPDDASAYTLIGLVEDSRNNRKDANESYKRALAIDSNMDFAANNYAWNCAEYGLCNLDEAIRIGQGLVQRKPDEPGYIDTLGWVYYKKNLYAAAVEQLQRAVDKARAQGHDSALYRYHLGRALAGLGRKQEARQQLQQALAMNDGKGLMPEQADDARKTLATL